MIRMILKLVAGAALVGILDPATGAQRWVTGAQGATQKFVDGVQNTAKDPTQLAIANQANLLANFTQAVSSGRWAANLRAAGKPKWQAMTIAKAANFGSGVAAAEPAYLAAATKWYPFIGSVVQGLPPRGTLGQNLARANALATALYNKKRTG